MGTIVKPDGRGRLLLPKDARESLGVANGGQVAVELQSDGSVVLRHEQKAEAATLARAVAGLRGSMKDEGPSVEDFLVERHADAASENEKERRLAGGS